MRDLILLGLLPLMLYAMAKRPFIALGMWVWTALFFPNGWVYGPASSLRYNLLFSLVTILGYLIMKHKPKFQPGALGMFVVAFFLWTTASTVTGIGPPDVMWEIWSRFAKIVLLFIFVLLIVEKKLHVDFLLWCVVLSVGFYANLEASKFILSGGGHKIAGMSGHVLGDRNELSIAFCMTLPICYYLLGDYGKRSTLVRLGLLGTIALLVLGVVGTQSRGGFIALLALAGYLFLKSERKILMGILGIALIAVVAHLASDEWTGRINTIETASEDASFMGRVVAWKLSFILAMDNPLLGGGFKSLEYSPNWIALSNHFFSYPWFYTGDALPNPEIARAAHSVYFQVLGEHGFVGLALYLAILSSAFFKAGSVARRARRVGAPDWVRSMATMLQLSIFTFALGAAALSFAYFDLIFALIGVVLVLDKRILPALTPASAPAVPRSNQIRLQTS
ncbi:putative O-glycosylation ligase, exosortase A system-associated [Massilia niastensis]|uniref:putative O-glycosylation ligase, exosortase A system-associated n=1 Tax=Massilia niastensis TaxID=544911 RepID=UPI00037EECD2|nr:putative O-glycosylation ligase, exosortase A system-associated [Massilia niastensis]